MVSRQKNIVFPYKPKLWTVFELILSLLYVHDAVNKPSFHQEKKYYAKENMQFKFA
jgi:hypothetical protein